MHSFLGDEILESKGPSNISKKNAAIKYTDSFLEKNTSITAEIIDSLKYDDITDSPYW